MKDIGDLYSVEKREDHFLHSIKDGVIPFVIIHGEGDSIIPLDHAKKMNEYLSRGEIDGSNRLYIFNECDHLCWITHGLKVVDILGKFWSK